MDERKRSASSLHGALFIPGRYGTASMNGGGGIVGHSWHSYLTSLPGRVLLNQETAAQWTHRTKLLVLFFPLF